MGVSGNKYPSVNQDSYGQWPHCWFDFPLINDDFPQLYVTLLEDMRTGQHED